MRLLNNITGGINRLGINAGKPAGLPAALRAKFLFLWSGKYDGDNLKDDLGGAAVITVTDKDWTTNFIPPTTAATFAVPDNATFLAADGADDFWFDASDTLLQKTHANLIASTTARTFIKYADVTPHNVIGIGILKAGETLTDGEKIKLNRYFRLWAEYWGELMDSGYVKSNRIVGEDWSSYWKPLSLFFLDGTILDVGGTKYFKDASSNGRNFLITGYDFADDWATGFPYKSAATISAPAGDAVLIAADINNFLYDAGGTPNQIPVISLFQDIDYEHKIFCKHAAQVLDGNGVETYEPRVSHIFMATDVLAGADLIKAQTDFVVPAEVTTNVLWVTKTGNNTTGNGTKANPYLTVGKAIVAGKTVYVKSGIYDENSVSTFNLLVNVNITIIGTGLNIMTGAGTEAQLVYLYGAATVQHFEGFVVDGENARDYCIYAEGPTKTVKRCREINAAKYTLGLGVSPTISNTVGTGGGILNNSNGDKSVSSSLINLNLTGYGIQGNRTGTVSLNNNRILINNGNGCNLYGGSTIFLGNKISINTDKLLFVPPAGTSNITMRYNTIVSTLAMSVYPIRIPDGVVSAINISNNSLSFSSALITSGICIKIEGQSAPVVDNNIFSSITENRFDFVNVLGVGEVVGAAKVRNNVLQHKSLTGYLIAFGSEASDANDDTMIPEISGNHIFGPIYYDATKTGTKHSVFVGHNINPVIKYNNHNGSLIGVVIKHTGGVYTSGGVYYNIFKNCLVGVLIKGANGAVIYNNTIVSSITNSDGITTETHTSQTVNLVIKNNIISSNRYLVSIVNGTETGLVCDYNIYYSIAAKPFNYAGAEKTWAEWQALGLDTHSIMLTAEQYAALFGNAAAGDYSLAGGSLAIGSGETLDAAYDDGLDASTDWGSDTKVPTIVTKQQGAAWDCGAYIH